MEATLWLRRPETKDVPAQLIHEDYDYMEYRCPSISGPAHDVVLRSPNFGKHSCSCIANTNRRTCTHIKAATHAFEARVDAKTARRKAGPCPDCNTKYDRPNGECLCICQCCNSKLDLARECNCFYLPNPEWTSCTGHPECRYQAAQGTASISEIPEPQLALAAD